MPELKAESTGDTWLSTAVIAAVFFALIYAAWLMGFLFFMIATNIFAIAIAGGVFMLTWNARDYFENNYFVWVGIGFIGVILFNFFHIVAMPEMGYLGEPALSIATQLRLMGAWVRSLTFLTAPIFIRRKVPARAALAGFLLVSSLMAASVLLWRRLPETLTDPDGPVCFVEEIIVVITTLGALFWLWRERRSFDRKICTLLSISLVFFTIKHLIFLQLEFPFDEFNLIGLYLRMMAFYFIYKAIVSTGLVAPYAMLFRNLKQSEENLKEERDFTNAVLDTAGAIVIVLDREGRIVSLNRAGERLGGYTVPEVVGRHVFDFFLTEEEHPNAKDMFRAMLDGRGPSEYENYWITKSGDCRLIHWTNAALKDADGNVTYVIGSGIDVTERHNAEQKLKRMNEELEKLVAERTEVSERRARQLRRLTEQLARAEEEERQRIAQVLHDELQQMIVAAKMAATRMRVGAIEYSIRESASRIEELLGNSINVSRSLTSELSPAVLKEPGLRIILDWLAEWIHTNFGLGVEVSTERSEVNLTEDARRFVFRSVRELLFNVVKHSGAKNAKVTAAQDERFLRIEVRDEGKGFDVGKIGTNEGFGLFSICERIADFGGECNLDSAPGKGACVTLVLPAHVVIAQKI